MEVEVFYFFRRCSLAIAWGVLNSELRQKDLKFEDEKQEFIFFLFRPEELKEKGTWRVK